MTDTLRPYIPEMRDEFLDALLVDDGAEAMLHAIAQQYGADVMILFIDSAEDYINPGENDDSAEAIKVGRVVNALMTMPQTIPANERVRAIGHLFEAGWIIDVTDADALEELFDAIEDNQPDIAEAVTDYYAQFITGIQL